MPSLVDEKYPAFLFLTTGGTIDAEAYPSDEVPRNVTPHSISHIHEKLQILGVENSYRCVQICAEDSKDVAENHLTEIVNAIKNAPEDFILISHGTDTIANNARMLQKKLIHNDISNKHICFVGAFEPLDNGSRTDGWDTLRYVIKYLMQLPQEVSVSVRSKCYAIDNLEKDFSMREMVGKEIIFSV